MSQSWRDRPRFLEYLFRCQPRGSGIVSVFWPQCGSTVSPNIHCSSAAGCRCRGAVVPVPPMRSAAAQVAGWRQGRWHHGEPEIRESTVLHCTVQIQDRGASQQENSVWDDPPLAGSQTPPAAGEIIPLCWRRRRPDIPLNQPTKIWFFKHTLGDFTPGPLITWCPYHH